MKSLFFFLFISIVIFGGCNSSKDNNEEYVVSTSDFINDTVRNRTILLEVYKNNHDDFKNGLVIINAGYGCSNTEYSYLAKCFSKLNYLVVAVNHEIQEDPLIPSGENIYELRLPFWENGMQTIDEVGMYVKQHFPSVKLNRINLVGHSNGGDIAVLYATRNPEKVASLITLDHRRVPLPENENYPIITFRADEFAADLGLIPQISKAKNQNIKVIHLENVDHNFMRDNGTPEMKGTIIKVIKANL